MFGRRHPASVAALAALLALAGCGLGPGRAPGGVRLDVTSEFGARELLSSRSPHVRGQETVMRLLESNSRSVSTRYGGGFVEAIDGLSGGREAGDPVDWFYYVNGVQASKGAAETDVHPGDRVWWDRHDWSQSESSPAVVGSFPEPFTSGIEGKRLPVRVECTQPSSPACHTVARKLSAIGVLVALALPSGAAAPETLRVLVGTFASLAGERSAQLLRDGPRASGVYGRVAPGGHTLTLLDPRGRSIRTLAAGAGLVAATRNGEDAPVWLVTGTDSSGVQLAASNLTEASLRDRFALALASTGEALPLPGER
jgi:uncharacterized protein DUF4430